MSHLPQYYPAKFTMRTVDPGTGRSMDLWSFKSAKSHRRYIVEVEYFSHNFLGLKFYWKGVEASKNRYSFLTNDYEPRIIVMSCIMIMLDYFKKNADISFGFVAAPDLRIDENKKRPNKRFRFYRRMMLSLFGPETFIQAYDVDHSLYIMINRSQFESGQLTVEVLEKEVCSLYEGDYTIVID